ncbi:hypothetical protein BDW68DRAFT_142463 [Aspergillus falconensis]
MAPNANDRPSFSFTFSAPQDQTRPASSSSSFNFSQRTTTFTFNSPPATGFNFSSPSFTFSAPLAGSTAFPSTPSQIQSPRTQSDSSLSVFTPRSSRGTTTPTTRALSTALDLGADSPDAAEDVPSTDHSASRSSGLSPNANFSTHRDLYNASPSPQPDSDSCANDRNVSNADTLSSSHLDSVTSGVRNLIVRSIETPSAGSEEFETDDIDSDFGSDGSNDGNSTYSLREEELPPAPIYDLRLQQSLREVRSHLADLVVSMERSELVRDEASDIGALYKQVESTSKFEYPETRIVGFIGDSGVGKSSLINSLLDHEGLARSSGNGEACTSVVTEFRQTDETHPHPFTIEVDFMNTDELKELLQELLRDYRMRHTRAFDEVTEQKESERITALARRALATLNSLFKNEADMTEEFLSNEAPHAEELILTRLEEWALAGLDHRPGGREALHHRIEARDIYHCRENIDIFTVASRPGKPALWPFVKLIRVYLRCPILRTGLVVADLPGFRDLNYARVRATERYLRHVCDEAFVVSDIGRCRTDPSIEETLEKRIRGQPIRIVCTMSECKLNAEESVREPGTPADVRNQVKQLIDRIKQAKRSLATTRTRRRCSSGAHQGRLAVQETDANDELERLNLELKTLLIETRNKLVAADLSKKYQPDVRIFCVSSKLYSDHRRDDGEQAAEYIRLSGIPELRRYCQAIPAEAQLRATSAFLKNRVPALLGSLNQWVLAGSNTVTVERAATLRRVLDEAQKTLESRLTSRNSCIRSAQADLITTFQNSIVRYIRSSQERWKAGATRTSQGWRSFHHSTYAAFCRKYGVHRPGNGSLRCWNNEILQEASEELDQGWSTLFVCLDDQQYALHDQIDETFSLVCASIEDHMNIAPEAFDNLVDNMETRRHCITDIVLRSFEDVLAHCTRIHRDALDGHSSTSYIADIMRPAYNVCNAESGGGSDARRKDHMDEHVRHSRIFSKLSQSIQADYMAMTDAVFTELRRKIAEEVQNITRDLGGIIAVEGEVTEAGREPELAQRVRAGVAGLQGRLIEAHLIIDRLRSVH